MSNTLKKWPARYPKGAQCFHCASYFEFQSTHQAKHFKYDKQPAYCSDICRTAARQKKFSASHIFGPCPTCSRMFESRVRKIYCSLNCYISSSEFQDTTTRARRISNLNRATKKLAGLNQEERVCKACSSPFVVPIKSISKKFCSRSCYHTYMSNTYDRFIASPDKIEIGQTYDEFLNSEELLCPMEGCGWSGHALSAHLNKTHNIRAIDFKKAAGFNLKQGIISSTLRKFLEQREYYWGDFSVEQKLEWLHGMQKTKNYSKGYRSIQALEAHAKGRLEALGTLPPKDRVCDGCGCMFRQLTPFGRKKFCTSKCRDSFYRNIKLAPHSCAVCTHKFAPNHSQMRRIKKGLLVVCSPHCRALLNSSRTKKKTLNADT